MELNYFRSVIRAKTSKEYLFPTLRICRVYSGEFEWHIGKNRLFMKSGDIVLLNNLVPRKIINTKASAVEIEVFEFSPTTILNRKLLPELFYRKDPMVPAKNREAINKLLLMISECYGNVENPAFFNHILQAIFDLLEDAHSIAPNGKCSVMVAKAVEFIWEHYSEDISVPHVADYLNISKNYLEKVFKDMYGIGVGTYIRIIRVYKVMSLIKEDTERSVLDIAFSCGFNSSSGFYKAYKDITGQNPRRDNAS